MDKTYQQAKAECQKNGMNLTAIETDYENDLIVGSIYQHSTYYLIFTNLDGGKLISHYGNTLDANQYSYYIGAEEVANGFYKWFATGEDALYTNWRASQPENWNSGGAIIYNFANTQNYWGKPMGQFFQWDDVSTSWQWQEGYICESNQVPSSK